MKWQQHVAFPTVRCLDLHGRTSPTSFHLGSSHCLTSPYLTLFRVQATIYRLGILWFIRCNFWTLSATAISTRKYWIPSDLQSQAGKSRISTTVGDHVGICRCRSFCKLFYPFFGCIKIRPFAQQCDMGSPRYDWFLWRVSQVIP